MLDSNDALLYCVGRSDIGARRQKMLNTDSTDMSSDNTSKTVLVTGATGFIGSHLTERLKRDGFRVRALARRTSNLEFIGRLGVDVVEGDVRDRGSLERAMDGVDAVFHSAALVGEWGTAKDFHDINVGGLINTLDAMKTCGVKRIIDVSTCAVAGFSPEEGTDETAPYRKEGILYGDSKVEAEEILWDYHDRGDAAATAIRPVMVWGPRDPVYFPKIIRLMKSGVFTFVGGGNNTAGLCHVRNVVDLIALAYHSDAAIGEVFLVNDRCGTTYREIVGVLSEKLGLKVRTVSIPRAAAKAMGAASESLCRAMGAKAAPLMSRMGMAIMSASLSFSSEKAGRILGYEPQVNFRTGIDEYIESWKSDRNKRRPK